MSQKGTLDVWKSKKNKKNKKKQQQMKKRMMMWMIQLRLKILET